MTRNYEIAVAVRRALVMSAIAAASVGSVPALAQDQDQQEAQTVVVTGTRITLPGVVSSSPVYSISADEIKLQQQPEIEKILRTLPITVGGDNDAVNNGTAGAATINLRGLGPQRNLILINGKRLTPYNFDGRVDTSTIPTALVDRIDIVTGGASAVYGSDAMSGAINFVLRRDFEGVEMNTDFSRTGDADGEVRTASLVLGSNVADGRGNVVLSINWTDREGVQLGARPLGTLGIETASGLGLDEFLAGEAAAAPPAGCGGPNSVASGGSTTTLPTRIAIAGGPGIGQFRDDGTIGSNCSVFNFNPYNYYQTPQQRFGGMVVGNFEIDEHVKPYARFAYNSIKVRQQVAPSGAFGDAFWTPLANPLISSQALNDPTFGIIPLANAGHAAGTVNTGGTFPNWRDVNNNNVVDTADELLISYRRRTVEFGERSTTFQNKNFQFIVGDEGTIVGDWNYDISFSWGQTDRTNINAGYTNVANIGNALDTVDGVTCRNGDTTCVPLNLFGGFGSITPEQAAYSSASAIEDQSYTQKIWSASVNGPVSVLQVPSAEEPLALSFGVEYRKEFAETTPDECLKLAPASCLGGAGGNTLPIAGGYDVKDIYGEAILPLVSDKPGLRALDIELGYRYSDYNLTGTDDTYKYGLSWKPIDSLRFRAMRQRAARAPNVGELASPRTAGLDNANLDPCSVANAGNIDATLQALCVSTGMSAAQVGAVEDIVSGQINGFFGTDLANLPKNEHADTTTVGFVFTPASFGFVNNPILSLDYYDIDIQDVIGEYAAQQVLDACYGAGDAAQCSKIVRIGGTLTLPGSGVQLLTTNLDFLKAEGLELGFGFGVDIGKFGKLSFSGNVNKYLTHESRTDPNLPTLDCLGHYGVSCGSAPGNPSPLPEVRWVQRSTWEKGDFSASLMWRHIGRVTADPVEVAQGAFFEAFQHIGAYNYYDLYGSWRPFGKNAKISLGIVNVTDKDPPVVGNEASSTSITSGNTFPGAYDVLGRIYSLGVNVSF
jgi:iron complex outermembrane recepter protein